MRRSEPNGDDRGSVLLLGIGLVVVCVLALAVLVDVTAVFLQRQRLFAVADAAAIAGAQAIDLDAYYAHGASASTRLDPTAVTAAVHGHLERAGARTAIPGMTVTRVWSDGSSVAVALQCPLHLPFLSELFGGRASVESWAQLNYRSGR